MSSTDPTESDVPGPSNPASSRAWMRLASIVVACALAGVLAAWALPTLLSSFEWPQFISKQWIDRFAHPPQSPDEPPPSVEGVVVQPIASPTLEDDASAPTPEAIPEATEKPPKRANQNDPPPKEQREAPKRDLRPAAEEPRDVTYKVDRRAISNIIRTPGDLGRHGRFVPNIVDGQRRGFKFVDVAERGLFDSLGVREGDVIMEVNGRALTTQNKLLEDLKALKSAHVYVVHIQRDDATRIHRYDAGPPLKRKTGGAAGQQ
ncbi:MAG: hypothetical protein ACQEVA_19115 [Myxococcota bacterium]